ncbi:hypothetical protein [Marivirga sericea]|uniref:hypothetical protein n=1 Tax=Marivirga sericea TaxID=1028 RepID=UPI0015948355|nr:hypothetical protein [Marivirga sericea]
MAVRLLKPEPINSVDLPKVLLTRSTTIKDKTLCVVPQAGQSREARYSKNRRSMP